MPKFEKKMNKLLVWAILWTTILGVAGASMTPKWRSLFWKIKDFVKWWMDELKKTAKKDKENEENTDSSKSK